MRGGDEAHEATGDLEVVGALWLGRWGWSLVLQRGHESGGCSAGEAAEAVGDLWGWWELFDTVRVKRRVGGRMLQQCGWSLVWLATWRVVVVGVFGWVLLLGAPPVGLVGAPGWISFVLTLWV